MTAWPGFLLTGELAQVPHYPESPRLRVAISTMPDPSGSGRVDMLTSPVTAARDAVPDTTVVVLRGSVGA